MPLVRGIFFMYKEQVNFDLLHLVELKIFSVFIKEIKDGLPSIN